MLDYQKKKFLRQLSLVKQPAQQLRDKLQKLNKN
jgi:hypothetical protein